MELDPGAVVLELERGPAPVRLEDLAEVLGQLGEHREKRDEEPDADALQARHSLGQRDPRNLREVGDQQGSPADLLGTSACGPGEPS